MGPIEILLKKNESMVERIRALEGCVRELRTVIRDRPDPIGELDAIARSLKLVPEPPAQPERRMDGKA